MGSNYHPDLFAAGAVTLAEELAAAKLALEHAVTQRNLTYVIAEQAQVFAEEAVQNRVQAQEVLAAGEIYLIMTQYQLLLSQEVTLLCPIIHLVMTQYQFLLSQKNTLLCPIIHLIKTQNQLLLS
jgi:hypothetical protein